VTASDALRDLPDRTRLPSGSAPRHGTLLRQLAMMLMLAAIATAPATVDAATATPVPNQTAVVEQPRAYGYSIGDLLQQRVALGTAAAPFKLAELPRIGRIGASLWRRRSEERIDAAGRHWLLLEYQLINTPQALSLWYLPALKLRAQDGSATLTVPNAPFSITPFTPPQPYEDTALPALQPDQPPAAIDLGPIDDRIRIAGAALAVILMLWAAICGWRHLRRGRHLPFARAMRDLRTLPATDPLAAQRRLHHALNDSAGEVVRPASLPTLLARAPYLASEQDALSAFLQESQAVFFGGRPAADSGTVHALTRRLRTLERRHAQ
jgi:mxaA protein